MSRRISFAAISAAVLAVSLPAAPSRAADFYDVRVDSVITQKIIVQSNGSSYHRMAPLSNLIANLRVELDTGASGRIKWFTAWLGLGREGLAEQYWPEWREDGYHKSFDPRPKSWSGTVPVAVPESSLQQFALGQCNYQAQTLRDQGLSNTAIFAQDRPIELAVVAHLDHEMTGPSGNPIIEGIGGWPAYKKIKLVCQKWPGAVGPQAGDSLDSVPPVVEKASLTLLERSGISGVCKVILSGVIETSLPNTEVRFRYKDDDGHQSDVHEVVTDHAGIAMFDHHYDIPNNPEGGESGRIRIVGVSHPFESKKRSYDMDCSEPAATGFQALLPPTLDIDVVPLEKVMVGQQLCVSKVRINGKITGRGPMSGYAAFVGDHNYISPPQAYEVDQGDIVLIGADRELDWTTDPQSTFATGPTPAGQAKSQTIDIGFNVTGESNAIVASLPKKGYAFTCVFPTVNPAVVGGNGGLAVQPRPQDGAAPQAAPQAPAQLALTAPLPDLKIQQARPGKNGNRLRVRVVNGGAGTAGASKLMAVYRRGGKNVVRTVPVKALKAGAKTVVVVDFGLPVEDAERISLTVDAPDQVKELNEQNNKLQFKG
ncbi:CARDB domain-containing protein [Pelagibius marinus]|uniref:CARDB domain-containing protein n=1 Tax=Pelagibius marinus TaxID=2762760 RepID=UPI0018728E11|nr:CARDB domain-containing protein [Pelagibius marinus]